MTRKYYCLNFLIGLLCVITVGYDFSSNPHDNRKLFLMIYSIASCLAFPFGKFAVESIALKFTSKDFWHKGLFQDDIGKSGVVAVYWICCFMFSIPLALLFISISRKA